MSSNYVLIDMPNHCCRSFYAMNGKSAYANACISGLFRDLSFLAETLDSENFVFCFDSPRLIRKEDYHEYKNTREDTPERRQIHKQIMLLKAEILPRLGFRNIFEIEGAEADDVIAFICTQKQSSRVLSIISTDKDLYQLLDTNRVVIWNPIQKTIINARSVREKYGVFVSEWVRHKAMVGDDGDNIPGVPGVGPYRAAQYIRKQLNDCSKVVKIIEQHQELIERNILLMQLPHPKLEDPGFVLHRDEIELRVWNRIMEEYGLQHLSGKAPGFVL